MEVSKVSARTNTHTHLYIYFQALFDISESKFRSRRLETEFYFVKVSDSEGTLHSTKFTMISLKLKKRGNRSSWIENDGEILVKTGDWEPLLGGKWCLIWRRRTRGSYGRFIWMVSGFLSLYVSYISYASNRFITAFFCREKNCITSSDGISNRSIFIIRIFARTAIDVSFFSIFYFSFLLLSFFLLHIWKQRNWRSISFFKWLFSHHTPHQTTIIIMLMTEIVNAPAVGTFEIFSSTKKRNIIAKKCS